MLDEGASRMQRDGVAELEGGGRRSKSLDETYAKV
jgi:hypothetical protein